MLFSWDEGVRVAGYVIISPILMYFAFVHDNNNERPAALVLGGLAAFLLMLLYGLVLVRYFQPMYEALVLNTLVIATTAILSVYASVRYLRTKRKVNRRLSALDEVLKERNAR